MKENKYDDPVFFQKYSEMNRSKYGLWGAGEWQEFQKMMPDFTDKEVLDLGCGYGWHCVYGVQKGAAKVLGVDLSEKMLRQAEKINSHEKITYQRAAMEDLEFPDHSFDIVLSSLAFHYVKDFPALAEKISRWLRRREPFFFLWNIPYLPHTVPKTGTIMKKERSFIFQWIITITKESGKPYFWEKRSQNTTGP